LTSPLEGEVGSRSEPGGGEQSQQLSEPTDARQEPPPEPTSPPEDFAITADVVELVTDPPPGEPVEPAEDSERPAEPPPADDPPVARDGFPESTDPGV
jgi:hypothetical protein